MAIDLYYTPLSPPCRSVMMTACSLGVRLNLKPINLLAGEHLTPEYIKINPQHNVPTIEDDGFRLNESRAICIYLVGRYGGRHIGEQLYPLDSKQRAIVDQRLYFDATVLFPNFRELYEPVVMGKSAQFNPESVKKYHDGFVSLNGMLGEHTYAAGNHLTIADFALVASVASSHAVDEKILDEYPNIKAWFEKCQQEIDHYEELNAAGARLQGQMVRQVLKSLQLT